MAFLKLQFKPGIDRERTRYTAEGGWYDCDKVRFRRGMPEKIGGWVQAVATRFKGVCRMLFNWSTLDQTNYLALGTHRKLYLEYGGAFYDITPLRDSPTLANPFATTNASTTVTVTDAAHGAAAGDFVTFSGASAVGGIAAATLNAEHEIVSIVSANAYTIVVATAATSTVASGGGASVVAAYQITAGEPINVTGAGWGAGPWSRGAWGSTYSSSVVGTLLRVWSADNFGEDLVACYRGGPIYYWDASVGTSTRAYNLATAGGATDVPTMAFTIATTEDRHLVAFGATIFGSATFDPLLIRWSNQEDALNWTPSVTTTAGDLRVPIGSAIMAVQQTRQETLVWTDRSLHSFQFIGPPYTFGLQTIADNVSIIGYNAAVTVAGVTYWMGRDKFFRYDGRVMPLPCSVQKYVFENIDASQSLQTYAGSNDQFGEVTWFYCSRGSYEPDRYVTYNYLDDVWTIGSMSRTSWQFCSQRGGLPLATTGGYTTDGTLLTHEVGYDDASTDSPVAIDAYIESTDFDIQEGERFAFVDQVIPDIDFDRSTVNAPTLDFSIKVRNEPGRTFGEEDVRAITKTASVDAHTAQLWMRLRGRQMAVRVESTELGVAWLLGSPRINVRTDGKKT